LTLVPNGRTTESEGTIAAGGEARSVDGTCLRWLVELELIVRGDIAGTARLVRQDTVLEREDKIALAL
jgi:hypothetical protein